MSSYHNHNHHHHLPIINNDVTVDSYNVTIPNVSDLRNTSRGSNEHNFCEGGGAQNHSSREHLSSTVNNYTSSATTSLQRPNCSSSDDFLPRQLIAVSDNAPSNYINSLDSSSGTQVSDDQAMELLQPMLLSSQRY